MTDAEKAVEDAGHEEQSKRAEVSHTSTVWYIGAVVFIVAMALLASAISPEQMPIIVPFIATVLAALMATINKISGVHDLVNSQSVEFLKVSKRLAQLEGQAEGREAQKDETNKLAEDSPNNQETKRGK